MAVFTGYRPDGRWENFEAEQECLADLQQAMRDATDGLVCVDVLVTRKSGLAERTILRRRPTLLSARHFTAIENCSVRIVEEDT